jgi:hypothetical protein
MTKQPRVTIQPHDEQWRITLPRPTRSGVWMNIQPRTEEPANVTKEKAPATSTIQPSGCSGRRKATNVPTATPVRPTANWLAA